MALQPFYTWHRMINIIIISIVFLHYKVLGFKWKDNEDCHLCGLPAEKSQSREDKIVVNGTSADPEKEYPWIVSIYRNKVVLCTGSIVSKRYILTAAHCFTSGTTTESGKMEPDEVVVELGYDHGEGKRVNASRLLFYKDFKINKYRFEHDIALLKLKNEIKCSKKAYPICITEKDREKMGKELIIAGFGHRRNNERQKKITKSKLTKGHVKQVKSKICKKEGPNTGPEESILCGTSVKSEETTCEGDSGGPIFDKFDGTYYILGLSSAISSRGECVRDTKSTFSKIYYYKGWLKKEIGKFPEPDK